MNKTIDQLAVLYKKIVNGSASEEERIMFEAEVAISCIQEDVLLDMIKKKAVELDK